MEQRRVNNKLLLYQRPLVRPSDVVQVHVVHELQQIGLLIAHDRRVAILKEAVTTVASIERDRLLGKEPAHNLGNGDAFLSG